RIALAILPGDGRHDEALDRASTVPSAKLRRLGRLCDTGGEIAAQGALAQLAQAAGLPAGPVPGPETLPAFGFWHHRAGIMPAAPDRRPLVIVPFYRAWLAAADTGGIRALIEAFEDAGFDACGLFVPSLKDEGVAGWLRRILPGLAPIAIVNATAFSARSDSGSPLDLAGVPVF